MIVPVLTAGTVTARESGHLNGSLGVGHSTRCSKVRPFDSNHARVLTTSDISPWETTDRWTVNTGHTLDTPRLIRVFTPIVTVRDSGTSFSLPTFKNRTIAFRSHIAVNDKPENVFLPRVICYSFGRRTEAHAYIISSQFVFHRLRFILYIIHSIYFTNSIVVG